MLGRSIFSSLPRGFFRFCVARPYSASVSPIGLNTLRPAQGAIKKAKRVGRGLANGGQGCGRGNNGQRARSGPGIPRGFEGGQTPLHLTIPKRGHHNPHHKEYSIVSLERIQHLIDTGRIDASRPITIRELAAAGVHGIKHGIKVMGRGSAYFRSKVTIEASRFSHCAIARIEQLGGVAASVYHDARGLRQLVRPESVKIHPSLPRPPLMPPMTFKERLQYSQWEHRGYLNATMRERLRQVDPTLEERHLMVEPVQPLNKPIVDLRQIPHELRQEGALQ